MFGDDKPITTGRVARWVAGLVITPLAGALILGLLGAWPDWVKDRADHLRDDWTCKGRQAIAEGDRLSELAAKDAGRAQALFREANTHYEKAFACGFPDAGIRLAGAHCLGLGTEKEPRRALQLLLQIEDRYPDKKMRIETAKKACNLL